MPRRFDRSLLPLVVLVWAAGVALAYLVSSWPVGPRPGGLAALAWTLGRWSGFHAYTLVWLRGLAAAAGLGWLMLRCGRGLLSRFFPGRADGLGEELALSCSLGAGALAAGVFALGAAGGLTAKGLAALLLLLAAAGLGAAARPVSPGAGGQEGAPAPWERWAKILLTLLFVLFALQALLPETFYDSLVYHLALPRLWLLRRGFFDMPWIVFSSLIMAPHMIWTPALALGGPAAVKLLHAASGALLLGVLLSFGRRHFSRGAGVLAALLFFSAPAVAFNIGTAGIDVAWSFLLFLSACALTQALLEAGGRRMALAGLATGLAAACRFQGLPFIPLAGALIVWRRRVDEGRPWTEVRAELLRFGLPALAPAALFLARNAWFHGNPVYPFGGLYWGHPRLSPRTWSLLLSDASARSAGPGLLSAAGLRALLLHPWTATMTGAGGDGNIGPLFLMALPALLSTPLPPAGRLLARQLAGAWLIWLLTSSNVRFALPVLALFCLPAAEGLLALGAGRAGRILFALILAAAAYNTAFAAAVSFNHRGWQVAGGGRLESEYLAWPHPAYSFPPYEALRWMNEHLGRRDGVLFVGESRTFYSDVFAVAGSVDDEPPLLGFLRRSRDGDDAARLLRESGITHLFLNFNEAERNEGYGLFDWDASSWAKFRGLWDRHMNEVWRREELRGDGAVLRGLYVYEIDGRLSPAGPGGRPGPFDRWAPAAPGK